MSGKLKRGIMGVDKDMGGPRVRVSERIRDQDTYHISFGTWSTVTSNYTLGGERV